MLLIAFTFSTLNDKLFTENILKNTKLAINITKNSIEKCLQIIKIPKIKYLKNLPITNKNW